MPELPASLKTLDCGGCSALRKLPQLAHTDITKLDCGDCELLTDLPDMPDSLTELRAYGLPQVIRLPELPVKSLRCLHINSTGISELPSPLQCVKELYCSSTPMHRLPSLPSCVELDLQCCRELQQLPETLAELAPRLKFLNCSECTSLQQLPQRLPPGLTLLDCSGCSALQQLPQQLPPGLTSLRINGCTRVVQLPELPPALKLLQCDGCNSLRRLPDLSGCPELAHVSLKGCVALSGMQLGKICVYLNE